MKFQLFSRSTLRVHTSVLAVRVESIRDRRSDMASATHFSLALLLVFAAFVNIDAAKPATGQQTFSVLVVLTLPISCAFRGHADTQSVERG